MGKVRTLTCPRCQREVSPAGRQFLCADCRMILDVQVDLSHLSADFQDKLLRRQDPTIWKWHEFLPVEDLSCIVSLGEGYTPLVHTETLAAATGLERLHIKNDCLSSNPYRLEGKKSYAFEVWEQLDGEVPDWMFHCTAGGAGVVAAYKGFRELKGLGWVEKLPRMVVAQADACAPIVRAFEKGADEVTPVEAGETIAESIRVGKPSTMATRALWDVRTSGGAAVGVTDDEIRSAQSLLARTAGVFGEPGGVVSVAAALKLKAQRKIRSDDLVVCTVSGHGLKQVNVLDPARLVSRPIPPSLDALRARVQEMAQGDGA